MRACNIKHPFGRAVWGLLHRTRLRYQRLSPRDHSYYCDSHISASKSGCKLRLRSFARQICTSLNRRILRKHILAWCMQQARYFVIPEQQRSAQTGLHLYSNSCGGLEKEQLRTPPDCHLHVSLSFDSSTQGLQGVQLRIS